MENLGGFLNNEQKIGAAHEKMNNTTPGKGLDEFYPFFFFFCSVVGQGGAGNVAGIYGIFALDPTF